MRIPLVHLTLHTLQANKRNMCLQLSLGSGSTTVIREMGYELEGIDASDVGA